MSVRKRKWVTRAAQEREAWIVDYVDQQGERHIETFDKKKDADARHAEVRVDVKAGVHVAPSKSVTVKEAGASWIVAAEAHGLERATVKQYREHVDQHSLEATCVRPSDYDSAALTANFNKTHVFECF